MPYEPGLITDENNDNYSRNHACKLIYIHDLVLLNYMNFTLEALTFGTE